MPCVWTVGSSGSSQTLPGFTETPPSRSAADRARLRTAGEGGGHEHEHGRKRENPGKAIEILKIVAPYELGSDDNLYSAYLRGQAYLMLGRGADAAREFQKQLEHRPIYQRNERAALSQLALARAYSMQGDITKAKAAYQDFLRLWKDADPDIPVLKQATAEYAKLH